MTKRLRSLLIPAFGISSECGIVSPFPVGLYSISDYCRPHGFDVDVLDPGPQLHQREYDSLELLADAVLALFDPGDYDIIGFSTMGATFPVTIYLAEKAAFINPSASIIFGGPHASFLFDSILKALPFIDAVVVGEGEETFLQMLQAAQYSALFCWDGVPGVKTRSNNFVPRSLLKSLDVLPVELHTLERNRYSGLTPGGSHELEVIRGCFASCRFCSTTMYWQRKVRRKSTSGLIAYMLALADATGLGVFNLLGDNFSYPGPEFREFCRFLITCKAGISWQCSCRIGDLKMSDIDLMYRAGCTGIFVGIESASQETLDKLNKRINLARTLQLTAAAVSSGIRITASHIIGFPWETKAMIYDTIRQHTRLLQSGGVYSMVNQLFPLAGADGFGQGEIIFDIEDIKLSAPKPFRSGYAIRLIEEFPELFINYGYFKTSYVDRKFVLAAVETTYSIREIVCGSGDGAQ